MNEQMQALCFMAGANSVFYGCKLLTGEAPFEGPRFDSPVRKLAALATGSSPDIRTRRDDLPAGLPEIINRVVEQ